MKAGKKKTFGASRCLTIKTKKIMKKNLFMVAAVALIATVSCNKELENNSVQGPASDVVFVAELEQPGDDVEVAAPAAAPTKTALGSTTNGVTAVNWVGNEKVSINGVEFTTTSTGAKATFTTTKTFDKTAAKFDAIYPASAGTTLTAVTIPASQKGTFAEAAISVATSTTTSLSFKNLASILKFQVPADCSEVTIESDSNLAGTCSVTFTNGLPVIGSTITNASKKITLKGTFVTGTDYYVAVLPGEKDCFEVRIDKYLSKAAAKVKTARATISKMNTLPAAVKSKYKIIGGFNSWNMSSTYFYDEGAYYVARNVKIGTSEFLFHDGSKYIKGPSNVSINNWEYIWGENSQNIKITGASSSAAYDVYLDKLTKRFYITSTGSAAPTTYKLYIQIENNSWSDYYIYAWANFDNNAYDGVWGSWQQCPSYNLSKSGNVKYLYMRFPSFYNSKSVGFKLSNKGGSGESSEISNVTLNADMKYKMNNTTLSKLN